MDTYGIINLTELDRMSENIKREISSPITTRGFTTMSSELSLLQDIKELCLKLPSAEKVFIEGRDAVDWKGDDRYNFEDYITQFIKSDKP